MAGDLGLLCPMSTVLEVGSKRVPQCQERSGRLEDSGRLSSAWPYDIARRQRRLGVRGVGDATCFILGAGVQGGRIWTVEVQSSLYLCRHEPAKDDAHGIGRLVHARGEEGL